MCPKIAAVLGSMFLLGGVCVAVAAAPIGNILAENPSTTTGLGLTATAAALRWAWWLSSKLTNIEDRLNTLSKDVAALQGHTHLKQ